MEATEDIGRYEIGPDMPFWEYMINGQISSPGGETLRELVTGFARLHTSFSHKSFHQLMVTRLPNQEWAIS